MDYCQFKAIVCAMICFFSCRNAGKRMNNQYRDSEGKPRFVIIPNRYKLFFCFDYSKGNSVLKAGVVIHLVGYLFTLLELLLLFLCTLLNQHHVMLHYSHWIACGYALLVAFGVMVPAGFRYETNIQKFYDHDWITHFQRVMTLYPIRQCKIIKQIDSSTYEITLGKFRRKKHIARTLFPVVIGERMLAVHTYEQGPPYWHLKKKRDG